MPSLAIGDFVISDDGPAFTIAECGHNHMGNPEVAQKMFRSAAKAGFNAVKLQKRDNKTLYTKELYDSPYTSEASYGRTYGEHREFLEFNRNQYLALKHSASLMGLTFFATAFDEPSAEFLARLGMPCFKVASGDLKNIPLIRKIAAFGKPVIVSTGGGTLEDVGRVYDSVEHSQLALLQCTAAYPCGADNLNLRVIETYLRRFPDCVVGLSDHHARVDMAPAAYALGARIFDKHITLDHTWKGTDHAFSLEPQEQAAYIEGLARVRVAMGSGIKTPLPVEERPIMKMGKGVYTATQLEAGDKPKLVVKSPAKGMVPYKLDGRFEGRVVNRPFREDEPLSSGDLE